MQDGRVARHELGQAARVAGVVGKLEVGEPVAGPELAHVPGKGSPRFQARNASSTSSGTVASTCLGAQRAHGADRLAHLLDVGDAALAEVEVGLEARDVLGRHRALEVVGEDLGQLLAGHVSASPGSK